MFSLGMIPVVWVALLIAPLLDGGLVKIVTEFPTAIENPFHIVWCKDSLMTVLIFLFSYGMGIGIYYSTRRHYRRGEEHGSAKWGDALALNKKYRAKSPSPNKIFTQNVRMGLNGKKHRRNLNTVVVGGSGAGKTRFFAKPCLYESFTAGKDGAFSSFVCLDPKGEFTGLSKGINEKGELLVELPSGEVTAIYAGEVSVRGLYGYV